MMIANRQKLQEAIAEAEQKKMQLKENFSGQLHNISENLKPGHILKSLVQNVIHANGFKGLLQTGAGMGAAFLAGKILPRKTGRISTSVFGSILKLAGVGIGIAKIKKGATNVFKGLLSSKKKR